MTTGPKRLIPLREELLKLLKRQCAAPLEPAHGARLVPPAAQSEAQAPVRSAAEAAAWPAATGRATPGTCPGLLPLRPPPADQLPSQLFPWTPLHSVPRVEVVSTRPPFVPNLRGRRSDQPPPSFTVPQPASHDRFQGLGFPPGSPLTNSVTTACARPDRFSRDTWKEPPRVARAQHKLLPFESPLRTVAVGQSDQLAVPEAVTAVIVDSIETSPPRDASPRHALTAEYFSRVAALACRQPPPASEEITAVIWPPDLRTDQQSAWLPRKVEGVFSAGTTLALRSLLPCAAEAQGVPDGSEAVATQEAAWRAAAEVLQFALDKAGEEGSAVVSPSTAVGPSLVLLRAYLRAGRAHEALRLTDTLLLPRDGWPPRVRLTPSLLSAVLACSCSMADVDGDSVLRVWESLLDAQPTVATGAFLALPAALASLPPTQANLDFPVFLGSMLGTWHRSKQECRSQSESWKLPAGLLASAVRLARTPDDVRSVISCLPLCHARSKARFETVLQAAHSAALDLRGISPQHWPASVALAAVQKAGELGDIPLMFAVAHSAQAFESDPRAALSTSSRRSLQDSRAGVAQTTWQAVFDGCIAAQHRDGAVSALRAMQRRGQAPRPRSIQRLAAAMLHTRMAPPFPPHQVDALLQRYAPASPESGRILLLHLSLSPLQPADLLSSLSRILHQHHTYQQQLPGAGGGRLQGGGRGTHQGGYGGMLAAAVRAAVQADTCVPLGRRWESVRAVVQRAAAVFQYWDARGLPGARPCSGDRALAAALPALATRTDLAPGALSALLTPLMAVGPIAGVDMTPRTASKKALLHMCSRMRSRNPKLCRAKGVPGSPERREDDLLRIPELVDAAMKEGQSSREVSEVLCEMVVHAGLDSIARDGSIHAAPRFLD